MSETTELSTSKQLSAAKAVVLLVLSIAIIVIGKLVFKGDITVILLVDAAINSALAIFTMDPEEIKDVRVEATYLDGALVYGR